MKVISVKNTSGSTQVCLVDGKQHVFKPGQVLDLTSETAQKCIEQNTYLIEQFNEEGLDEESSYEDTKVYIANMSGNPDGKQTVIARQWDATMRRKVPTEVPNLLNQRRPYVIFRDKGMEEYSKNGVTYARNLPKERIVIKAGAVKAFPEPIANWILSRAGNLPVGLKGWIKQGRPEPAFWPNNSWEYDDVRDFLLLHDPEQKVPEEAELLQNNLTRDEILAQKKVLLHKLFFIHVDPERRLFSRKEFNAWMAKKGPSLDEIKESATKTVKSLRK